MVNLFLKIVFFFYNFYFCQNQDYNYTCKNIRLLKKIPYFGIGFVVELNINFIEKDDFNFNCLYLQSNNYKLNLLPSKRLSLNFQFNYQEPTIFPNKQISLNFLKITSFDLNTNLFIHLQKKVKIDSLNFFYSEFFVLSNGTKDCLTNKTTGIFGKINILGFGFSVRYFKQTCPIILANSEIQTLQFYGFSDTFLIRNKLEFLFTNKKLNTSIQELVIKAYQLNLNEAFFDKNLFEKLKRLELRGVIRKISIKNIPNFVTLDIYLDNILEFIFINQKTFKTADTNEESKVKFLKIYGNEYKFSDQDLCYFKSFIYLEKIRLEYLRDFYYCTCTVLFLLNISLYKNDKMQSFNQMCSSSISIDKCKIEKKLESCNLSTIEKKLQFTPLDLIYISEILNFITLVTSPVISIITILVNLLNLKILYLLKSKQNSTLSKLMIVNSMINFVYSVINFVHLINKCVYVNGIFCSAIFREKLVQIFEIIFVEFLLNNLKTWSNISIISISWLRLCLLISDKPWLKMITKFQKKKKAKFLFATLFTISLFLSIDKLFVVRVNENFFVLDDKDYEEFPNKNTFMLQTYRDLGYHSIENIYFFGTNAIIFYALFVSSFILNDILLYLILFLIDLTILYYLRIKINFKKKLAKQLKMDRNKLNDTQLIIDWTVGVNLMIVFILRFIHFSVSLYIFIKKLFSNINDSNICFYYSRVCSNYMEFSEQFYNLSNAYTIILFRNLNKDFKESLNLVLKFKKPNK